MIHSFIQPIFIEHLLCARYWSNSCEQNRQKSLTWSALHSSNHYVHVFSCTFETFPCFYFILINYFKWLYSIYHLILEPKLAAAFLIGRVGEYLHVTLVGHWLYCCEHFRGCGLCVHWDLARACASGQMTGFQSLFCLLGQVSQHLQTSVFSSIKRW